MTDTFFVIPGNVIPGNVIPGNAIPGNAIPGNAIPGNVIPGNVIPGLTRDPVDEIAGHARNDALVMPAMTRYF